MAGLVFLFGLFMILFPIVNTQIENALLVHYRYMIERSLRTALVSSFSETTEDSAFETFKNDFITHSPHHFTYTIKMMNFEANPKFVRFKVHAIDDTDVEIEMEDSMIEEDKNEIGT